MLSCLFTTTRAPPREEDGAHYNFISVEEFEQQVQQQAFMNTPKSLTTSIAPANHGATTTRYWFDVILEIDWRGLNRCDRLLMIYCVFILPPSIAELEKRLRLRGQDNEEVFSGTCRMPKVKFLACGYDYIIINDEFEQAVNEIQAVF